MRNIITLVFVLIIGFTSQAQNHFMPDQSSFPTENIDATIYPNPVTENRFAINSSEEIRTIEIMNVIGQTILKKDNTSQRLNDNIIYLDNMEKGLYLVKITFEIAPNAPVIKKMLIK